MCVDKCPIQHIHESVIDWRRGSRFPTGSYHSLCMSGMCTSPRQVAISFPRKRCLLSALFHVNKSPDFTDKETPVGSKPHSISKALIACIGHSVAHT